QHASQAVPDPVDAVVTRLMLDVIKNGRNVVLDQVIDRPAPLSSLSQKGLAEVFVDSVIPAHVGVFARPAYIEDVHLVTPACQLRGEMVVGNRPKRVVESKPVAENHG